jgi:hypothetical protein
MSILKRFSAALRWGISQERIEYSRVAQGRAVILRARLQHIAA